MKKIKKIKENGIYIFTGRANANSCFIEKINHAKKFLIYANYYLKDYLSVYDYIITKDGWSIVVKIKSTAKSDRVIGGIEVEIWRLISERMRLFLSTFVRVTNRDKGRTGCLVHSSFDKYEFENKKDALFYIEKIRNQKIKFYSKRKKYRGVKTHYKISKLISKGSIFLCSKEVRRVNKKEVEFVELIDFVDLRKLVVENNNTFIRNHNFLLPNT